MIPDVPDGCGLPRCRGRLGGFMVVRSESGDVVSIRPLCEAHVGAGSEMKAFLVKRLRAGGKASRRLLAADNSSFLTAPEGMAVWAASPGARLWDR